MLKERLFVTFIPDVKMWTSFKQYLNVHGEHPGGGGGVLTV